MLQQERLVQMGDWLKVNGEAIYGTSRWGVTHEGPMVESVNPRLDQHWKWTETNQRPMIQYTSKGAAIYAVCLAWPGKLLKLEAPATTPQTQVRMLGCSHPLTWSPRDKGLVINIPEMSVASLPCRNAWVFKLTGLGPPR
jgi:alpha-L-fucosidase